MKKLLENQILTISDKIIARNETKIKAITVLLIIPHLLAIYYLRKIDQKLQRNLNSQDKIHIRSLD